MSAMAAIFDIKQNCFSNLNFHNASSLFLVLEPNCLTSDKKWKRKSMDGRILLDFPTGS